MLAILLQVLVSFAFSFAFFIAGLLLAVLWRSVLLPVRFTLRYLSTLHHIRRAEMGVHAVGLGMGIPMEVLEVQG